MEGICVTRKDNYINGLYYHNVEQDFQRWGGDTAQ